MRVCGGRFGGGGVSRVAGFEREVSPLVRRAVGSAGGVPGPDIEPGVRVMFLHLRKVDMLFE